MNIWKQASNVWPASRVCAATAVYVYTSSSRSAHGELLQASWGSAVQCRRSACLERTPLLIWLYLAALRNQCEQCSGSTALDQLGALPAAIIHLCDSDDGVYEDVTQDFYFQSISRPEPTLQNTAQHSNNNKLHMYRPTQHATHEREHTCWPETLGS